MSYFQEQLTKGGPVSATIELLGQQHQEVLARLSAVEHAPLPGSGAGVIADLVRYLEREVLDHFIVEEQALFPVLERHLNRAQGPLAVMDAEHATVRELMEDLAAALRSGDVGQQQHRTYEIISLLRDHIAKEDHVLFPMAAQLLSAEERAEVDSRAAAIRPSAAPG